MQVTLSNEQFMLAKVKGSMNFRYLSFTPYFFLNGKEKVSISSTKSIVLKPKPEKKATTIEYLQPHTHTHTHTQKKKKQPPVPY